MKIKLLCIMICLLCNSCSKYTKRISREKSILKYIDQFFKDYAEIHKELGFLVEEKAQNNLMGYSSQKSRKCKIDKLIVLNKERNKLYTTVNTKANPWEKGSSDLIKSLYGFKIEGKWHIYIGKYNLIAMRDGYKNDIYEPFTWEELS